MTAAGICSTGSRRSPWAADTPSDSDRQQKGQGRQDGQDVARLLADGGREEQQRQERPDRQSQRQGRDWFASLDQCPQGRKGGGTKRRPREHSANDDRQVEPDRPRIVEPACRKALEVVAQEEAVHIRAAVLEPHREVPRKADRGRQPYGDDRAADGHAKASALEPPHRQDGQGGDDQANRALRQEGATSGRTSQRQPARRARMVVERSHQRRIHRQGHEEGQREIGKRQPANRKVPEAGGDDGAGEQARRRIFPAPAGRGGQQGEAHARQRCTQPCLCLADAGDGISAADQPVGEDRLLEARLVVVVRCPPIAALAHLARGLGIERLVGIADGGPPESGQKRHAAKE